MLGRLAGVIHVRQRRQRPHARHRLLEQCHPLARDLERHERGAGEVAAGARQAPCDAQRHRIATDREEHRRVLHRPGRPDREAARDDEGDAGLHELVEGGAQGVEIGWGVAKLEHDVAALDVAEFLQPLAKPVDERIRTGLRRQPADAVRSP
jgi:hypothetical protein